MLRCRSASAFESRYLRKGFSGKITVYRILDSRREKFRLGKAYEHKVDVINVVTAPEIEMLIILNENRYDDFKKSGMKPSEYCMTDSAAGDNEFAPFKNIINEMLSLRRVRQEAASADSFRKNRRSTRHTVHTSPV